MSNCKGVPVLYIPVDDDDPTLPECPAEELDEDIDEEQFEISSCLDGEDSNSASDLEEFRLYFLSDDERRARKTGLPSPEPFPEPWYELELEEVVLSKTEPNLGPVAVHPIIDPTVTQLAYGIRALPKLNRELNGANVKEQQVAVTLLCDYLHLPENVEEAHKVGVTKTLKKLLRDQDPVVREKASECFKVIAGHAVGRCAMIQEETIPLLAMQFHDDYLAVRRNSYQVLRLLSQTYIGARSILTARLVPKLLTALVQEPAELKSYILDTIHFCLVENTEQALHHGAMNIFRDLLFHENVIIQAKAARAIMDLCVSLDGKNIACKNDVICPLVELLKHQNAMVKAKVAGALMMITITTEGRFEALKQHALYPLLNIINDSKFEVRLNALKALTNLAESPEGRATLLGKVKQFKKLTTDTSPSVRDAATIAVKVIMWKP